MAAATGKVASVLVLISACVISSAQDVLKYSIYEHLPAGAFVGDVREDSKLRSTASAEDFSQIDYSLLKQRLCVRFLVFRDMISELWICKKNNNNRIQN